MRAIVIFLLALACGCDGSPQPKEAAKPIDDGGPLVKPIPASGSKPAGTTPAAQKLIGEMLAAHTNSKPAALEAFRNCIVQRIGEVNVGSANMPAECSERFAWPDRYRVDWKFGTNPIFLVNGDSVRMVSQQLGFEKPPDISPVQARDTLEDVRATWMTLLVPLLDSKGYIADTVLDVPPERLALRVWVGHQPPLVLEIDAKSRHLKKIHFEKVKDGRIENWMFILDDLKPVNGVILPHKLNYTSGRTAGASWVSVKYEVVASFPLEVFIKP